MCPDSVITVRPERRIVYALTLIRVVFTSFGPTHTSVIISDAS